MADHYLLPTREPRLVVIRGCPVIVRQPLLVEISDDVSPTDRASLLTSEPDAILLPQKN